MEHGARRRRAAAAGHRADQGEARSALGDDDAAVRATALGALARMGALVPGDVTTALVDPAAAVRRRAAEVAERTAPTRPPPAVRRALRRALADPEPLVTEAVCWALGEAGDTDAVGDLATLVRDHTDTRCREAAVAALGAIGDPGGLAAVLGALDDKPTVRRRAAVALAAFDDPAAEDGLTRCLGDRDWQVRQIAEILLAPD